MKILAFRDEPEMKHWPVPFAGIAPKVRAWVFDAATGHQVELPTIQYIEAPYHLRANWHEGYYRMVFEGGTITVSEDDFTWIGQLGEGPVIEGERVLLAQKQLEGGAR